MPVAIRYFKEKALLLKLESTYGTEAVPVAADAIKAQDVTFTLENDELARAFDTPTFQNDVFILNNERFTVEFTAELFGSGTAGTAPKTGAILRAAGFSETVVAATSVTYAPVTNSPDSATIYLNIGGVLFKGLGSLGTLSGMDIKVGDFPKMKFKFTGLFVGPIDQATLPAVDYTSWLAPVALDTSTVTGTVHGLAADMIGYTMDSGREIKFQQSSEQNLIAATDRKASGSIDMWNPLLSTKDYYAIARASTQGAISIVVGTAAGSIATITHPLAQLKMPQPTDIDGVSGLKLDFVPFSSAAGDDETSIAFT